MYDNGLGIMQDYAEAIRWYRKAVEQGHIFAQWTLGYIYMYSKGRGVPQDYTEAIKWYRRAAEQDPLSQATLGNLYDEGMGVAQDYAEAMKWRLSKGWPESGSQSERVFVPFTG